MMVQSNRLFVVGFVIVALTMGAKAVHRQSKCPFLLLITILLTLLDFAGANLARALKVRFEPTQISDLKAGRNETVNIAILVEKQNLPLPEHPDIESKTWAMMITVQSSDEDTANVDKEDGGSSYTILPLISISSISQNKTQRIAEDKQLLIDDLVLHENITDQSETLVAYGSFVVHGNFIGKTQLDVDVSLVYWDTLTAVHPDASSSLYRYSVWILRSSRTLNAIFVSTLGCLIILANVLMGCNMNLDVVFKVIKRPVAPAIGFTCQFLLMPLIAYALAHIFLVPAGMYSLALGLYTSGCVPGGGASNFWTVLLDGNSDLSITMTFISTVAAMLMMPLWMMLLGGHFIPSNESGVSIEIPYKNISISLLSLVVPLLIGLAIKKWLPKVATVGRKVLRPFLIFIIVFIVAFGSYANLYMFKFMNWRVLTSGLLLPWCGFMFGCFSAILFRQPPENVAAIAIETGIQNSGVAIMLLKVSFPQPDADMSSVIPVVVSIFTPVPLLMGWAIHKLLNRFKRSASEVSIIEKKVAVEEDEQVEEVDEDDIEKAQKIVLIEQSGNIHLEKM